MSEMSMPFFFASAASSAVFARVVKMPTSVVSECFGSPALAGFQSPMRYHASPGWSSVWNKSSVATPYSAHCAMYLSTRRPMPAFARPMKNTRAPSTIAPAAAPSGAEKLKSPEAGAKAFGVTTPPDRREDPEAPARLARPPFFSATRLAPYDALADSEEAVDMGSDERACGSGLDDASVLAVEEAARAANWTTPFFCEIRRPARRADLDVRKLFEAPFAWIGVRAGRAGDARVRLAMPPLSGKDAILAAARRLAELGDDALDEDLLDAELALAGPAHDEDEAFAGGPVDGEPPLRPEDLGLPPRLAAWLARHGGRDVRRAFGADARAARRLVHDADGHVALGRAAGASVSASHQTRPRYAPLEERVVPLSEAAAPTPRAFEFVPPAELERREALRLEARSAEAWRRGERAKEAVDPRRVDNAAVSAETKILIAAGSRREREADLPKGAGPAGRHEPTTRADERMTVPSVMGVSLFSSSREDDSRTNLPPGLRRAKTSSKSSHEDVTNRLTGAERRSVTNALLQRLPEGERPVIGTTSGRTYGGVLKKGREEDDDPLKVPRTVRQATLDALVAAALSAEAEARGVKAEDTFEAMTTSWLAQRPKTRKRAIAAGVEAERRVFRAAASAAAYRGLAATALSALKKKAAFITSDPKVDKSIDNIPGRKETKEKETAKSAFRGDKKAGEDDETDDVEVRGDLPDALCVVPRAARAKRGEKRLFLARADEAAVAAAAAFAREGLETTRRRERGVGFVAAARAGALLQNYTNPDADRVDLKTATTPLGASVAFWAETAKRRDPRLSRTGKGLGSAARAFLLTRRARPSLDARAVSRDREKRDARTTLTMHGTTEAKDEKDEGVLVSAGKKRKTNADADAKDAKTAKTVSISNAARALIRSFLEPFLDVGTITEAFARSIENKAAAKVLLKRGNEPDASFLERDKERDAVKALTREYVRRGEKRGARDAPETKETKETKRARAEAKSVGTRLEAPKFDFDVDDL